MKLQEAVRDGLRVGALIHEKTGTARAVEVLAVEDSRLLAVSRGAGDDLELFGPSAPVRLELPREASVVSVPGRVTQARRADGVFELEISCADGAEERQRRMDVRVAAECRVHVRGSQAWEQTRTVNISAGGALLANGGSVHAGYMIDVELDLDGETIRCQAEVVRRGVKTGGVSSRINAALRFVGLPAEQRDRIALFVLSVQASEKAARPPRAAARRRALERRLLDDEDGDGDGDELSHDADD